MAGTDPIVTIAVFLKLEAPDGDVRLCDGGMLDYSEERYESFDAVFGTIAGLDGIETGFGDLAERGTLLLAPNPDAALSDWWRGDLMDCRVRLWKGEIDSDGVSAINVQQLADWQVDTVERRRDDGGVDLLALTMIGRPEKLFLRNEGNVVAQRFHQTVFAGEKGFNNCTDIPVDVPWGTSG